MSIKTKSKQEKIDLLLPIICSMIYISSYLGRHSYNSNINQVMEEFGVSHSECGIVTTFFFFAYGVGQVVHGIFCRRYNEKIIIPIALGVSSVMNLAIFCGIDFSVYKYLWLINAMFLSILWPTLVRVLSKYLSGKALSHGCVLLAAASTVGYFISYSFSSLFTAIGAYKLIFLFAAGMMMAFAAIWIFAYYRLGLNKAGITIDPEKAKSSRNERSSVTVIKSRDVLIFTIVLLGIYSIILNCIKDGLHVWVPTVLKEKFNLPSSISTLLSLVLSICALPASMLCVKLNKIIKNYLLQVELIFVAAGTLIFGITGLLNTDHIVITIICLGFTSMLMHTGASVSTSLAPLELRDHMDSGLLSGILNGCCYVGSTISSYALGAIADNSGWSAVFYFLLTLACVPVAILLGKSCVKCIKKIIEH